MKCYRKQPEVKAKNNAYMQKYRHKSNTELDLNKIDNFKVCKEINDQRNGSVNYTIKRKSGSIFSTETYHADEKVKRAKLEKKKQYSQKPEVKKKNKLYMRDYRARKKIANSSTVTRATECLETGVSNQNQKMHLCTSGELHKQEWAIHNMQKVPSINEV